MVKIRRSTVKRDFNKNVSLTGVNCGRNDTVKKFRQRSIGWFEKENLHFTCFCLPYGGYEIRNSIFL